jgi:hypothetical protein
MTKGKMQNQTIDEQIARARENSIRAETQEPRAVASFYDRETDHIVLELANGCTFTFPPALAQGLGHASADDLNQLELTPAGDTVYWEKLDVHLSIPDLLAGLFGTKRWMAEIGRKGGRSTSTVKASAARENGKKGGRPATRRTKEPTNSDNAEQPSKLDVLTRKIVDYRNRWAFYECSTIQYYVVGAGSGKTLNVLGHLSNQIPERFSLDSLLFTDNFDDLVESNNDIFITLYVESLKKRLDHLQHSFALWEDLSHHFSVTKQLWIDLSDMVSERTSTRVWTDFIRCSLTWDAALSHLIVMLDGCDLMKVDSLSEGLMEPYFAFGNFAHQTIPDLESAPSRTYENALSASLQLAEYQIKNATCFMEELIRSQVKGRKGHSSSSSSDKGQWSVLSAFQEQQRELIAAAPVETDLDYKQLTRLSPSAALANQCCRCLYLARQCNETNPRNKRLVKDENTNLALEACARLPWMVARDSTTFGIFVFNLWTICEWAMHKEIDWLSGEPPLEKSSKVLWSVKKLRDNFVHLGLSKNLKSLSRSVNPNTREALALLDFKDMADSPDDFGRLQKKILTEMEQFFTSTIEQQNATE